MKILIGKPRLFLVCFAFYKKVLTKDSKSITYTYILNIYQNIMIKYQFNISGMGTYFRLEK